MLWMLLCTTWTVFLSNLCFHVYTVVPKQQCPHDNVPTTHPTHVSHPPHSYHTPPTYLHTPTHLPSHKHRKAQSNSISEEKKPPFLERGALAIYPTVAGKLQRLTRLPPRTDIHEWLATNCECLAQLGVFRLLFARGLLRRFLCVLNCLSDGWYYCLQVSA